MRAREKQTCRLHLRREGEEGWPIVVEVDHFAFADRMPGDEEGPYVEASPRPGQIAPETLCAFMREGTRLEVALTLDGKPKNPAPLPLTTYEHGEPTANLWTVLEKARVDRVLVCTRVSTVEDAEVPNKVDVQRVRFEPAPEECGIRAIVEDGRKAFRSQFEAAYFGATEEEA
jgi:hypothetical protein